ncbi:hypothetical protein GCM10023321_69570 [Pseudonocardia eucalypti]|uniref:VanZ-like domain-containing protein n=1 Tax=Pseudonocardia eucalypti TaxID=648755 RepID=A0ABP9R439_9PSEU|nr:hypothetical protein [Pseudonocardia eucalypti]
MSHLFEAAHQLRWLVPISRWTPLVALLGVAFALLGWRPLARWARWYRLPTLGALLALAGVVALTLSPRGWYGNHRSLAECVPTEWWQLASSAAGVGGSAESILNIVLFVPLGFCLVMASRRVMWPAALMASMPIAIELLQVVVPGRQCSPRDWLANALGGLIGVTAAALTRHILRRRARRHSPIQSPQHPDSVTSAL